VSVDSETLDQEWAVVSVVGCRSLNLKVNFLFFCESKIRSIFAECPCQCHEGL